MDKPILRLSSHRYHYEKVLDGVVRAMPPARRELCAVQKMLCGTEATIDSSGQDGLANL
jgi:hypothetical protein